MDEGRNSLNSEMGAGMGDGDAKLAFEIGKISGQLRELLHTTNNTAMKLGIVTEKLSTLSNLPETVADLNARVTILERQHHKNEGEKGLLVAFLKSPAFVWMLGATITIAAATSGHLSFGG